MASEQLMPLPTPGFIEASPEPNEWRQTSDGSVTVSIPDDRPSEKKEEEDLEVAPVIPKSEADDCPDGGFAAWCIVLGVSKLAILSALNIFLITLDRVEYVRHIRNVGHTLHTDHWIT